MFGWRDAAEEGEGPRDAMRCDAMAEEEATRPQAHRWVAVVARGGSRMLRVIERGEKKDEGRRRPADGGELERPNERSLERERDAEKGR